MIDFSGKRAGDRIKLAGILALSLFVLAGIIYSVLVPPIARYTDETEYLTLSANLAHGHGFSMDGEHLTAARAPGYAFFLAALRLVGCDFVGFRVAQYFLVGVTIFLVARLCAGRTIFAGLLIATGVVACYPILFYISATLYPQTCAAFLFILALSFLFAAPRGTASDFVSGISFGALILVTPTFLLTMVVVIGTVLFLRIISWRSAAVVVVGAALVVGAWTLRNAIWLDHFVPVATNSGLNLLEGNNPAATPEAAANVGMRPYYVQVGNLHLDEFQTDAFFRASAVAWIEAHPYDAFILYLEKTANFFNVRNVYATEGQREISPGKELIMAASYLLLLGLLAWRLADFRRFPLSATEKCFLIVYILSAFTSAIFFTRIRHRLPYDYLIISIVVMNLSARLQARLTPKCDVRDRESL